MSGSVQSGPNTPTSPGFSSANQGGASVLGNNNDSGDAAGQAAQQIDLSSLVAVLNSLARQISVSSQNLINVIDGMWPTLE